jgi:uncharacterized protein (TIGR02453 family)
MAGTVMPQRKEPGPDVKGSIFSQSLFQFLRELKANNNREWFLANRDRFEAEVKMPMLALIMAFAAPLERINKHYVANPRGTGGSMLRINRDTRFSMNKEPYKTNVGAYFRHRECSREISSPGFYLHLEPGECFVSTGLWHPDPESLRKVRERIVSNTKAWKALRNGGIEVGGDALKRVPPGFDPDHVFAEYLKLKDFHTHTAFKDQEVCSPDFLERFTDVCRGCAPLVAFLTKALELPW